LYRSGKRRGGLWKRGLGIRGLGLMGLNGLSLNLGGLNGIRLRDLIKLNPIQLLNRRGSAMKMSPLRRAAPYKKPRTTTEITTGTVHITHTHTGIIINE